MALPPQISTVKAPSADVSRAQPSRRQTRFNLPFLLVVTLLVGYGLMVVWSAVSSDSDYSFTRQLAGVAVGAVLMLLIWQLDYRRLADLWLLLLVVNVMLGNASACSAMNAASRSRTSEATTRWL